MMALYGVHNLGGGTKKQSETQTSVDNGESKQKKAKDDPEALEKSTCIPGMSLNDIKKLSTKEYIEKFSQGTCAPVTLVPGFSGCQIIAEVNCEVLRGSNPEIFQECGWNTCEISKNPLKKAPKSEYKIWVPIGSKPFNIVDLVKSDDYFKCYIYFMSLHIETDDSENVDDIKKKPRYQARKALQLNLQEQPLKPELEKNRTVGPMLFRISQETSYPQVYNLKGSIFSHTLRAQRIRGIDSGSLHR